MAGAMVRNGFRPKGITVTVAGKPTNGLNRASVPDAIHCSVDWAKSWLADLRPFLPAWPEA